MPLQNMKKHQGQMATSVLTVRDSWGEEWSEAPDGYSAFVHCCPCYLSPFRPSPYCFPCPSSGLPL